MESGEFELKIAGQSIIHKIQKIEITDRVKRYGPMIVEYQTITLGTVNLKPGRHKLSIKPITISAECKKYHQGLMKIRDVALIPKGKESLLNKKSTKKFSSEEF